MNNKVEKVCPLGHKTKPKLIMYAGAISTIVGFAMPNTLAVCKKCGIVFDPNIKSEPNNINEEDNENIDQMLDSGYILDTKTGKWIKD